MTFLIARNKRARAQFFDALNRTENPPKPPWGRWGDSRTATMDGNGIRLGDDKPSGWFPPTPPNGGWGYAYQPQTPHWAVEFTRAQVNYNGTSHEQHVYIDQDWTAGEDGELIGGKGRYQTLILLERRQTKDTKKDPDTGETTTETKNYYEVSLVFRDIQDTSQDWFNNQPDTGAAKKVDIGATAWNNPLTVRLEVHYDNLFVVYINGAILFGMRYNNANYKIGPGHRALNFAHKNGPSFYVRNVTVEDIDPWPDFTRGTFQDTFNRANNATVGNGWTQRGTNSGGIFTNAYSQRSAFSGTDGWQSIARDVGSADTQRVEVILGGGTGDPTDIVPGGVMMRMNSAGTSGLMFNLQKGNLDLYQWSSGTFATSTPARTRLYPFSTGAFLATLNNGDRLTFSMYKNYVWVELNGNLIHVRDGLPLLTTAHTWVGLGVNRGAFANSVPFNNFTVDI